MTRRHFKLVPTLSALPAELPEVILVQRLNEARDAWLALLWTWWLPPAWFAWCAAVDRLEAQRIRTVKGW